MRTLIETRKRANASSTIEAGGPASQRQRELWRRIGGLPLWTFPLPLPWLRKLTCILTFLCPYDTTYCQGAGPSYNPHGGKPGKHRFAIAMKTLRFHLRFILMLAAATAMMLSLSGSVSACSMGGDIPACCAGSDCCCGSSESRPAAGLPDRNEVQTSSDRCDCRSDAPSSPASKPRSAAPDHRTDHDRGRTFVRANSPRIVRILRPLALPNESSPRAPIYLCTSRLLT